MSLEAILMHYGDDVKKVNQEKVLLEYARITTHFDKYRGNPDFFHLPCSLGKRLKCSPDEPIYFAVKTKEETHEVPVFEFVETPDFINEEKKKSIVSGIRNIYQKWQNSEYRQQQLEKYSSKIDKILPHRPHLQKLIVIGESLLKMDDEEEETEHDVTEKTIECELCEKKSVVGKTEVKTETKKEELQYRLRLTINDIELNPDNCSNFTSRKLHVNFEYDIKTRAPDVKYLLVHNTGSTSVRISWKKVPKFMILRDYSDSSENEMQGFYFNKNDLVVLPNKKIKVPIWFKVEVAGTYSESWEITTEPKIWNNDFHLLLILHSYSYFGDFKQKVDSIMKFMDNQVRHNFIKDILREIIVNNVSYNETKVAPCVYKESHLFEIANLVNDRPLYLYDEDVVEELKIFYENLTKRTDWNFCIKCITKLAKSEDIATFLRNKEEEVRMKITTIEKSQIEELEAQPKKKPNKKAPPEKKPAKKDKKSSPKTEEEPLPSLEIPRENYIYSNQQELWNLIKKLDAPVIINREREKLFACTQIVSTYFSKMCDNLDTLDRQYDIVRNTKYPEIQNKLILIPDLPDRMVYETFESDYLSKKVFEHYPFVAKRKPKILNDIPSEDVATIYTTYFGKTVENADAKAKGKKKPPKKPEKGKKDMNKGTVVQEISIESFNPYAEQFVYDNNSSEQEESIDKDSFIEESLEMSEQEMKDYKYRQYLAVYGCMSQAVEALVDTIESFEKTVPYPTLNEIKNCLICNSEQMEQ